jgi:nitrate reductase gamma subunit
MNETDEAPAFTGHNRGLAIAVGLSPIWILAFVYFAAPTGFGEGMNQPTEAQIQVRQLVKLVSVGIVGLLMVAGTILLWRARSARTALGALLLFTFPALFLVILGPAFVLIFLNWITPAAP